MATEHLSKVIRDLCRLLEKQEAAELRRRGPFRFVVLGPQRLHDALGDDDPQAALFVEGLMISI